MRLHTWRIHNASFDTKDDSLASYDNSNNFGFSPGYGETITICLVNQTRYFKSIDLGPGNSEDTPSML